MHRASSTEEWTGLATGTSESRCPFRQLDNGRMDHQRNETGMEALLTVLRMTDSRGTTQSRVTLSLRRSSPSTPPAAAAADTREDGWATGRAETVTLDSHAIRTMTSGKSPLDRHPGPSLLLPFLSLSSPGCPSSSIWATGSAFVFLLSACLLLLLRFL